MVKTNEKKRGIPYAPSEDESEDTSQSCCDEIESNQETSQKSELKTQWLASFWKLDAFNDKLPPHERKAEWRKFRDQFERIADCKIPVDPVTKLKGMKIHAGEYLLKIIEMQEETIVQPVDDIYCKTVELVNRYFELLCDKVQERIKFRQMRQREKENFTDWILRLESQSKFCDFENEQRKEEFLQALIGNSVPDLAEKLYEASNIFHNDIPKIIQHGQHLYALRIRKMENKMAASQNEKESEGLETRPIMWVAKKNFDERNRREHRFQPYKTRERRNYFNKRDSTTSKECDKCGKKHSINRCPAYRSKCHNCGKVGHWVRMCRGNGSYQKWSDDKKEEMLNHVAQINKVEE